MIFGYQFWKSLVAGIKRRAPVPKPASLSNAPASGAIEDCHTHLARAAEAWRNNDLDTAVELMAKEYAQNRSPDIACSYASLMHHLGRSNEARSLLYELIAAAPEFLPAQTQLARMIKMDRRAHSADAKAEITQRRALISRMQQALECDPFFRPSEFWRAIAAKHERMLDDFGIDNFKRTVAHNYQNWLIVSAQDGQWQSMKDIWRQERYVEPVLNTIEAVDDAGMIWEVENPRYALSSPGAMAVYKMATGVLWEIALARDQFGFLAGFEESLIGNPIRLRRNGRLISQDAAHSARELNTLFSVAEISKTGQLTFAELGAGQGRLAEMIGRATNHRYLIFDIAPTLAVSQWYIQQLFPAEKIFAYRDFDSWDQIRDELDASRFAFFTANQIKLMPKESVDVFINMCSLMEMQKQQIDYFLARISEVTRGVFMSKQWYEWENTNDNIRVTKDDFRLREGFDLIHEQPDEIHKALFLQIWRRR